MAVLLIVALVFEVALGLVLAFFVRQQWRMAHKLVRVLIHIVDRTDVLCLEIQNIAEEVSQQQARTNLIEEQHRNAEQAIEKRVDVLLGHIKAKHEGFVKDTKELLRGVYEGISQILLGFERAQHFVQKVFEGSLLQETKKRMEEHYGALTQKLDAELEESNTPVSSCGDLPLTENPKPATKPGWQ